MPDPPRWWQPLLEQHESGDGSNPEQVHHTTDEQQQHKTPTTTEAAGAVAHTEQDGAEQPRAELTCQISGWALTVPHWKRSSSQTADPTHRIPPAW